jgi:hypothetical protein
MAFDNHMIDLATIVSSFSFVLEVGVGASGDDMDHVWVGRLLLWREGSHSCSGDGGGGGGRLGSILFW